MKNEYILAVVLFILSISHSMLGCSKTIAIMERKPVRVFALALIGCLMSNSAMVLTVKSNTVFAVFMTSLACAIGAALPVIKKSKGSKREVKTWILNVTSDSEESGKNFLEMLQASSVGFKYTYVLDKNSHPVLGFEILCETKEESKTVFELIPNNFNVSVIKTIQSGTVTDSKDLKI